MDGNIFQKVMQMLTGSSGELLSPIPKAREKISTEPAPKPAPDYKKAIEEGFKHWGDVPASKYADKFVEAINKYPIFKQYPFMLPALSILETSGGAKMKQEHNILNWGIHLPKGYFNPQSPKEVIDKAASGIASRMPYYDQFRKSGDLLDFANVYAPLTDNPETGGHVYAQNLKSVMDEFAKYL